MNEPGPASDFARQALEVCLCFHTRKASRAITQVYDHALAPTGLKATQLSVLMVVNGQGPVSMGDLANALVSDATTVSRTLKPLLAEELVSLSPGVKDRRIKLVSLTGEGRRALDQALPLWQTAQTRVARQLSSPVVQALLPALESAAGLGHLPPETQ